MEQIAHIITAKFGWQLMKRLVLLTCCLISFGPGHHRIEMDKQNILILGNSHSVDAFHLLYEACMDQYPETELTLGVLYYSGCSISEHVSFAQNDDAVYIYFKNSNGEWTAEEGVSMRSVLQDQPWTVILLQAAKSDLDDTLNKSARRALEAYVNKYVTAPHTFMWHTSWPSPNDEYFFSDDAPQAAPEGYKENLIRLYGFDPVSQYTVLTDKARAHIFWDEVYSNSLCTGTGIMHAYLTEGCPQTDLWRDYTHLSDFGRLVAAYSMLTQLTGEPIEEIHLDTLPAQLRYNLFQPDGDLFLSEEMKAIIQRSANYALTAPFSMPEMGE